MQLYLIRHADALPLGEPGIDTDAERPLTPKGDTQVAALAKTLQRFGVPLGRMVTSPLVRSLQTAERLREQLGTSRVEIETSALLAPGGSSKRLAKFLRNLDADHIALVGHEPDLGRHTAWLIGSKRARIEFAKGGIACVACDHAPAKGAGALLWLLTPAAFVS